MTTLSLVEPVIGSRGETRYYRCILASGERVAVGELTLYNGVRFAQAAKDQTGLDVDVNGDWPEKVKKAKEPIQW